MANANIYGINVHYETYGSGPPLLMMAPGGFDSIIEMWRTGGIWKEVRALETIAERYTCIAYDRREAGESGGRVERVSWASYAHEAKGLLDHLGIPKAFVLGACMGCSAQIAFGVTYPESTLGLVLHHPVGGPHWRTFGLDRFNYHTAYAKENGLEAVVRFARENGGFWGAPSGGPWASTMNHDEDFARAFTAQDPDRYGAIVKTMGRTLFDRDTVSGAEPEELMSLKVPAVIVPGNDLSHTQSAARYLQECLPRVDYHDVPVEEQTADVVRAWILDFLDAHV